MLGDNKTVVTSSTIPHSTLGKRWNALSYHPVREAIAGGWLRFEHIPGTENPADILKKTLPLKNWVREFADALDKLYFLVVQGGKIKVWEKSG